MLSFSLGGYGKLFQQDATWRHFLPRQHGYTGEVPATLDKLTMAL